MEMAELNEWLKERNLNGHWNRDHRATPIKPYLWRWSDIYEGLQTAAEVVPMDQTGRRTIQLRNPSMPGGMSNTIHLSIQLVKPGEIANISRRIIL